MTVLNDRRIQPFDVVPLVNHPPPPALLDVIRQLDAQRAVIPRPQARRRSPKPEKQTPGVLREKR